MKKRLFKGIVVLLALLLVGCGPGIFYKDSKEPDLFFETVVLEDYPGYYAMMEEGIISVTNYDPNAIGNIPAYQELIEYGEGAGMEHPGLVYSILILDCDQLDGEEAVYYASERDGASKALLMEEDHFFSSSEKKDETVEKLMKILESAKGHFESN